MDNSYFSVNSSTIRDKNNSVAIEMQQCALFGAAELYMSCQKNKSCCIVMLKPAKQIFAPHYVSTTVVCVALQYFP